MLQNLVNETTDKYDGVLKELAALLVPHLIRHSNVQAILSASSQLVTRESVEEIVQAKIDALGPVDKDAIRKVCEEVIDMQDIDDKVSDWMQNNWDIADYESEIRDFVDVDDAVERHLNNYLHDQVVDVVQGLKFTVEVSSR